MSRQEKILQMLAETPNDTFLLFAMGLEKVKENNDKEALTYFNKILSVNENYCAVYFHLGKLFERQQKENEALTIYEKGMDICKKLNEMHNFNELRSALDSL
jgi:tetratricopeptide (TPR) repeat protein